MSKYQKAIDYLQPIADNGFVAQQFLQLAVAVKACRGRGSVLSDMLILADGGAVAIDDGAAHKNELLCSVGFCLKQSGIPKRKIMSL